MIATLAVHDAMSKKVDIETIATQIIPQLWVFSVGPLLNAEQFSRFMTSIKTMSKRVEDEHLAHLKEVRRMQEHTESYVTGQGGANGSRAIDGAGLNAQTGEISFAALVGGAQANGPKPIAGDNTPSRPSNDPFGLHDFGPALTPQATTPSALSPNHTGSVARAQPTSSNPPSYIASRPTAVTRTASISSLPGATRSPLAPPPGPSRLASPLASSSVTAVPTPAPVTRPAMQPPPGWGGGILAPSGGSSTPAAPSGPSLALSSVGGGLPPLVPTQSSLSLDPIRPLNVGGSSISSSGPNYNISLPTAGSTITTQNGGGLAGALGGRTGPAPPSWGAVLQPANKSKNSGGGQKQGDNFDLSGFDPLS